MILPHLDAQAAVTKKVRRHVTPYFFRRRGLSYFARYDKVTGLSKNPVTFSSGGIFFNPSEEFQKV
jgi:hypothetical protein